MKAINLLIFMLLGASTLVFSQNDDPNLVPAPVETEFCSIAMPVLYTPAEDAASSLEIKVTEVKNIRFAVFDRWGRKVFTSDLAVSYLPNHLDENGNKARTLSTGWDAIYEKQALNNGTYFFVLEAVCLDGKKQHAKGNLQLSWKEKTAGE